MKTQRLPVITLWQPWASWVAMGCKTIETRTHAKFACLKGKEIGIHAGKQFDDDALMLARDYLTSVQIDHFNQMRRHRTFPKSVILCTAIVKDAGWLTPGHSKEALIECFTDRFGLILTDIKIQDSEFKIKGKQGIWYVDIPLIEKIV